MATNFDLFEGPNFDLKLDKGLATSNFEFGTSLQQDEKETLAPVDGDIESPFSPKVNLALEQTQAADNSLPQGNSNDFSSPFSQLAQASQNTNHFTAVNPNSAGGEINGRSNSDFTLLGSSANFSLDSADDSKSVNLNVPKSGDIRIDALLHRHKWTTPTITYSFFDDAKGGPYYSNKYKGV